MFTDDILLQEDQPPQTGMEMEGSPAEGGLRHALEDPHSQTGSHLFEGSEEIDASRAGSEARPQTSLKSEDGSEFQPGSAPGDAEDAPLPQIGSKMGENEGSVVLKAPEDAGSSQTGIKNDEEEQGSAVPARSRSRSDRTAPRRRRVIRRTPVLAIGDGPTVETEADKARSDLLDLVESQKTGRILTGTIQGVERPKLETSLAVLYHGSFKIIIPAERAVTLPDDRRGRSREELYNYMLTKRLGAEVDYIRPLAKLSQAVKVANTGNQGKSKRKVLSPVTVRLGEDTKSFDKTDGVFDQDTFSGNLTVIFALLPGQGMIPGALFRQEGIGV